MKPLLYKYHCNNIKYLIINLSHEDREKLKNLQQNKIKQLDNLYYRCYCEKSPNPTPNLFLQNLLNNQLLYISVFDLVQLMQATKHNELKITLENFIKRTWRNSNITINLPNLLLK